MKAIPLLVFCLLIGGQVCLGGAAEDTILNLIEFADTPLIEAVDHLSRLANETRADIRVSVSLDLTSPDPRLPPIPLDPKVDTVTIAMENFPLKEAVRYIAQAVGLGWEITETPEVFAGHTRTHIDIVFTDPRQSVLFVPSEQFFAGRPGVYAGFHKRVAVESDCRLFVLFDLIARHSGITIVFESGLQDHVATVDVQMGNQEHSLLSLLKIAVAALEHQTGKDVVLFHPASFVPSGLPGRTLLGIGLREKHPLDVFECVRPPGHSAEDADGGPEEVQALQKFYEGFGVADALYHEPDLNAFLFICRSAEWFSYLRYLNFVPMTPDATYRAEVSAQGAVTVAPVDNE